MQYAFDMIAKLVPEFAAHLEAGSGDLLHLLAVRVRVEISRRVVLTKVQYLCLAENSDMCYRLLSQRLELIPHVEGVLVLLVLPVLLLLTPLLRPPPPPLLLLPE